MWHAQRTALRSKGVLDHAFCPVRTYPKATSYQDQTSQASASQHRQQWSHCPLDPAHQVHRLSRFARKQISIPHGQSNRLCIAAWSEGKWSILISAPLRNLISSKQRPAYLCKQARCILKGIARRSTVVLHSAFLKQSCQKSLIVSPPLPISARIWTPSMRMILNRDGSMPYQLYAQLAKSCPAPLQDLARVWPGGTGRMLFGSPLPMSFS